ncbi:MAG: hypothetical protein OEZ58_13440 [Gammaproteobacteria bacterium]|nr:hypothetical protein [Gammaproteobacteria bacterium]MDH5729991.1 hypothetical protein [Gammaproteobacteria bacterium]
MKRISIFSVLIISYFLSLPSWAQNRYFVSIDNGVSTAAFSTGEISSSHARWLMSFNSGILFDNNLSTELRVAYSPVATLAVAGESAHAADLNFIASLGYRDHLINQWSVFAGVELGAIRSFSSSRASKKNRWIGEYGLNSGFSYQINQQLSTGLRSEVLFYRGLALQFSNFWAYHF